MLGRFHTTGKLVKVATDIVELTPNRTTAINLAELNQMVADQKGITVEDLAMPNPHQNRHQHKQQRKLWHQRVIQAY